MKKIYILSLCLDAGGIEKCVCLLANALVNKQYDVTIVSVLKSKPILPLNSKVVINTLTPFTRDKAKRNIIYKVLRRLFSKISLIHCIKKIQNSVIISTRNEYSTLLSKYGNDGNIKIAQLHHDHLFEKKILDDFRNKYSNIDYFVHLTEIVRKEVEEVMLTTNNRTKNIVIPNFVEPIENIEVEKENLVVSVGRFSPEKGFLRLIDVWAKIVKKNKTCKLVLIGDGPERTAIEERIKQYKLEDSVIMPGFLSNDAVFKYMKKSKIYALPSYTEAFPFALIEAMQMKLALVSFDIRVGPRVLIKNNVNGFLVEDGNIELFAEKVLELLSDDVECKVFADNSLNESKNYLEETVIKKWISIFN